MNYAGVDLHKKYSYITVVNQEDKRISNTKINNDPYAIQNAFLQLNNPITAAVEATFNAY